MGIHVYRVALFRLQLHFFVLNIRHVFRLDVIVRKAARAGDQLIARGRVRKVKDHTTRKFPTFMRQLVLQLHFECTTMTDIRHITHKRHRKEKCMMNRVMKMEDKSK